MNVFDRIYALHKQLAGARHPIAKTTLEARLECSPATIKRIIRDMRLYLDAPIEYDREYNGYYYAEAPNDRFELPGLWFNASELVSLLALDQLLETVQPGLLSADLAPLRRRVERILDSRAMGAGELSSRTRVLRATARAPGPAFAEVASALAMRRRLAMRYHGRGRNETTERRVSPQRLVYYRDNWYLDAWCHQADGLRSFSVDRIRAAETEDESAEEMATDALDAALGAGYGIFSGPAAATACLRFSAHAARWVADEQWHPDQQARWLDDGRYELSVPYAASAELARDIMAYGPDVEVIAPAALRRHVAERLAAASAVYAETDAESKL
ncbi:YafY family protein [Salinisphaera sp. Q1T1-3]|uniref:helix-turn-helix transcriptional regulator n=1 Tax=Salinisphaera sp. Q1T1-3 TaxID=2321229 RepID=UPI000E76F2E2|nr:WYL domain-containing protein [Salinisphaera sp. Q1T1-3]RJS94461.1 WYL domain-containing protein [Salinisphaera sp. Q1T1-3]